MGGAANKMPEQRRTLSMAAALLICLCAGFWLCLECNTDTYYGAARMVWAHRYLRHTRSQYFALPCLRFYAVL